MTHRTVLFTLFCTLGLAIACDEEAPNDDASNDAEATTGKADGIGCNPTGVPCTPECSESGELPNGVPCMQGNFDEDACECVPLDDGVDGDGGYDEGDDGYDDDDDQCPPTGVVCTPECPESGELANGVPCEHGEWDDEACTCVDEGGDDECAPTGVACTPDCPESGELPDGVPCQHGVFDEETCACEDEAGDDDDDDDDPVCPPTGVVCTPECPESGELPSGAPCAPGNLDPQTCECEPL